MNRSEEKNLLVITSYPSKSEVHGKGVVGIASYAKNTLTSLFKQDKNLKISVLAEKLKKDSLCEYTDDGISVARVWKRGSFLTFPILLKEALKRKNDSQKILIEFELSMFGNVLTLLPFPLFLFILKILGKKTYIVLHQVVMNMDEIGPHLNIAQKSLKASLYSYGMKFFYKLIVLLSHEIIVFEKKLKDDLQAIGETSKITVIPHGVEINPTELPQKNARKELGIPESSFVIVVFGFLAWYKGSDFVVQAIVDLKKSESRFKNIHLIMAGGPNPNHLSKNFYVQYIQSIEKTAKENGITITGFVEETKINQHYAASDLIILPYRTFMSSSGPLSLAFTYNKPVIFSEPLRPYFRSQDLRSALIQSNLKENDLIFQLDPESLSSTLTRILQNKDVLTNLTEFSSLLKKNRSWDNIAKLYYEKLFN